MTTTTTKANTKVINYPNGITKAMYSPKSTKKPLFNKATTHAARLAYEIKKSATLTNAISDFSKAYATDSVSKRNAAATALNKALKEYNKPLLSNAMEKARNYDIVTVIKDGYNNTYIAGRKNLGSNVYTLYAKKHSLRLVDCMNDAQFKKFKQVSIQLYADLMNCKLNALGFKGEVAFTKLAKDYTQLSCVNSSMKKCKEYNDGTIFELFNIHLASEDARLLAELLIKGLQSNGYVDFISNKEFTQLLEIWAACKVKNISFKLAFELKKKGKKTTKEIYKFVMQYNEKN